MGLKSKGRSIAISEGNLVAGRLGSGAAAESELVRTTATKQLVNWSEQYGSFETSKPTNQLGTKY